MRECPDCGLFSTDTASRCDCGFAFAGVDWVAESERVLRQGQRFLFGGVAAGIAGAMGGLSVLPYPFRMGLFMWAAGRRIDLGMLITGLILAARGAKLSRRARRLKKAVPSP